MKRINVTFFDEIFEKLEDRMQKNSSKSIAQSIRELVELGLKIEEAANNSNDKNSGADPLDSIVNMLKSNLIWSLETRLLTRHLIEKNAVTLADDDKSILDVCKERAANYVMGMLGEEAK
jgi:hypothetical protein